MSGPSPERERRLARLAGLYAVVGDGDAAAQAAAALAGGAAAVQVRMKAAPAGAILAAARRIVAAAAGRALVIVNDRADLALLAGADGVHLGDEDLPVPEARRLLGEGLLVGRTCRTAGEARRALAEGADHVGFGPIFATGSKALAVEPRGLEALRVACAALPAPVVAIGGISESTIAGVAAAGAAAAAVIGGIFGGGDPRERAALLSRLFAEGRARR